MRHALIVLTLLAVAGCTSFTPPNTSSGATAYAGSTLAAVERTAASQYRYMPKARVQTVHALIGRAQAARDAAIAANQAGHTAAANTALGRLSTTLGQIQTLLNEANHE